MRRRWVAAVASRREIVSAYRWIELRAYRVPEGSGVIGKPVKDILPGERLFVERVRRNSQIIEAEPTTILQAGDIAAISGRREVLVQQVDVRLPEVEDAELLDIPAERVDVFVTNPNVDGKTLQELSDSPFARGVFLRRVLRNRMELAISWDLRVQRGDILTLAGGQKHIEDAVRAVGVPDRPEESTDMDICVRWYRHRRPDRDSGVGFRQIGTWTVIECWRAAREVSFGGGSIPCDP